MTVEILEFDTGLTKEGKPYYRMNVLGKFNSFGKLKTSTVDVNLTKEQYEKYKTLEGKKVDLDFVIPKPQFPLTLTEKKT